MSRTLPLILGACVFVLLFRILSVDLGEFCRAVAGADPLAVSIGCALQAVCPLIRARRWIVIRRAGKHPTTYWRALALTSASGVAAAITPARIGEASRIALSREEGTGKDIMIEYFLDVWVLLSVTAGFLSVEAEVATAQTAAIATSLVIWTGLSLFGYCIAGIRTRLPSAWRKRLSLTESRFTWLTGVERAECAFWTCSLYALTFASAWLIFLALNYEVPALSLFSALAIGQIAGVVSFIPMGFGTREAGVVTSLARAGHGDAAVLASLIIHRCASTVVVASYGIVSLRSISRHRGR